jgi:hypothetical protein
LASAQNDYGTQFSNEDMLAVADVYSDVRKQLARFFDYLPEDAKQKFCAHARQQPSPLPPIHLSPLAPLCRCHPPSLLTLSPIGWRTVCVPQTTTTSPSATMRSAS